MQNCLTPVWEGTSEPVIALLLRSTKIRPLMAIAPAFATVCLSGGKMRPVLGAR